MNLDALEHAWKSTPHGRVTGDLSRMTAEVRSNDSHLRALLFRRDVREAGAALVMAPVIYAVGARFDLPWTWYLAIPAELWVAGFIVTDRIRQRRREAAPGDSLREHIDRALAQIEHQIQLLRTVFWWYLLPVDIAVTAFMIQVGWQARHAGPEAIVSLGAALAFCAAVTWGVYRMNQWGVKSQLEPRRRQLSELRDSLRAEA